MRARWLLLLVLVGCGDDLPTRDAHSGTRLRLSWFDFDGTRQWEEQEGRHFIDGRFVNTETYFDSTRNEPCAPEPWLDGITRCTPDVELIDTKRYADSACTMRVTENPQLFKYVGDYDDKCSVRRVWHVLPVVATVPHTELFYRAADGKCWPAPSSSAYIGVLGGELPYDTFATIDTAHGPSGDRIQMRYRESDDGMVLPIGLYDGKLGRADVTYFGDYIALPPVVASGQPDTLFYADAACTRGYVRVESGCGAPANATGDFPTYYAIGSRAPTPPTYARSFGMCMPLANTPDGEFYEVLTQAPLQPVIVSHSVASVGTQRVQLQFASTSGGVTLRLRELYDTLLATDCVPRKFPDDVYRCAPDQAAAELVPGAYSDPSCQTPIEIAQITPGHAPPRLVLQDRVLLGGGLKIFELGAPFTDVVYSFGGSGGTTCGPFVIDDVYRVGRQVEWSELATATLEAD